MQDAQNYKIIFQNNLKSEVCSCMYNCKLREEDKKTKKFNHEVVHER